MLTHDTDVLLPPCASGALAPLMILEDGQSVVYRQRVLDPVPVACLAVTRTLIAPQEHTVVEAVLMMRATVGAALQAV